MGQLFESGFPELDRINRELQFPCAVCGTSFGNHSMGALKQCFQKIASVKRELQEIRACDKCDLCEDHHA